MGHHAQQQTGLPNQGPKDNPEHGVWSRPPGRLCRMAGTDTGLCGQPVRQPLPWTQPCRPPLYLHGAHRPEGPAWGCKASPEEGLKPLVRRASCHVSRHCALCEFQRGELAYDVCRVCHVYMYDTCGRVVYLLCVVCPVYVCWALHTCDMCSHRHMWHAGDSCLPGSAQPSQPPPRPASCRSPASGHVPQPSVLAFPTAKLGHPRRRCQRRLGHIARHAPSGALMPSARPSLPLEHCVGLAAQLSAPALV